MAASPSRMRSSALLVVPGSTPLGSVMWVEESPSFAAAVFILATNAFTLCASQSASSVAMSPPESIRRPSRAWSSVSDSPAETGTSDSWSANPAWYDVSVVASTGIDGPSAVPVARGWSDKTT